MAIFKPKKPKKVRIKKLKFPPWPVWVYVGPSSAADKTSWPHHPKHKDGNCIACDKFGKMLDMMRMCERFEKDGKVIRSIK